MDATLALHLVVQPFRKKVGKRSLDLVPDIPSGSIMSMVALASPLHDLVASLFRRN